MLVSLSFSVFGILYVILHEKERPFLLFVSVLILINDMQHLTLSSANKCTLTNIRFSTQNKSVFKTMSSYCAKIALFPSAKYVLE